MKKVTSCVLAAAMVAGSMGVVNASTDSIIGRDRFETAAKIADRVGNYNSVVLVNGYSTADGLSASSLAKYKNAPILLVKKDYIPSSTLQRLNNVSKVYIIGGTGAISQSIENQLISKGKSVDRIGGKDRVDTSLQVADRLGNYSKAFIVNGYRGEADAMSVAPVAARDKAPIIITNGKKAPTAKEAGVKYYAIGGNAVVQNGLAGSYGAERLSGSNRYATNKRILNKFYSGSKKLYVANGETLVDALAVSMLASDNGVALTNRKSDKSILKGKDIVQVGGNVYIKPEEGNAKPEEIQGTGKTVVKSYVKNLETIEGTPIDISDFKVEAYNPDGSRISESNIYLETNIKYKRPAIQDVKIRIRNSKGEDTYINAISNIYSKDGERKNRPIIKSYLKDLTVTEGDPMVKVEDFKVDAYTHNGRKLDGLDIELMNDIGMTGLDMDKVGDQTVEIRVCGVNAECLYIYPTLHVVPYKIDGNSLTVKEFNSDRYQQKIVDAFHKELDEYRVSRGLDPVGINYNLVELSYRKSKHMCDYEYFEHLYNGKWAKDMYPELLENMNYDRFAENIAYIGGINASTTPESVAHSMMTLWKNSPGHNAMMLNKELDCYGFGCYADKNGNIKGTLEGLHSY